MENQDYLSHHGILGMKWGRRNGPPYPLDAADHSASERKAGWTDSLSPSARKKIAKQYKKRLNKLDEAAVKEIDNVNVGIAKGTKQINEIAATKDRLTGYDEKTARKAAKSLEKQTAAYEKTKADVKMSRSRYDEIEKETWKVIGEAIENGYDIESEKVYRDARKGKRALGQLLLGPVGQMVFAGNPAGNYGVVEGNRYRVGSGSPNRMGSYTTRVRVRGS